jgi:hypothetical protein
MGVTREVMKLNKQGMTPRKIRSAVDAKYADLLDQATPTPYPPA